MEKEVAPLTRACLYVTFSIFSIFLVYGVICIAMDARQMMLPKSSSMPSVVKKLNTEWAAVDG